MSHEDEEEDDDNNNTNNNYNDDNDDGHGGDHVSQQQHTITREYTRTRGGRGHRTRVLQTHANPIQQDERLRRMSRRTHCGTSSHYYYFLKKHVIFI